MAGDPELPHALPHIATGLSEKWQALVYSLLAEEEQVETEQF